MVRQPGTSILYVSADFDSTEHHPVLYGTIADSGKSVQCIIAIRYILSHHDIFEKLWKDLLDTLFIHILWCFSDSITLSFRSIDHSRRYVLKFGYY